MPNRCTASRARNRLRAWSQQMPDNLGNWSSRPMADRALAVSVREKIGSLENAQHRPKRTFNITSGFYEPQFVLSLAFIAGCDTARCKFSIRTRGKA